MTAEQIADRVKHNPFFFLLVGFITMCVLDVACPSLSDYYHGYDAGQEALE